MKNAVEKNDITISNNMLYDRWRKKVLDRLGLIKRQPVAPNFVVNQNPIFCLTDFREWQFQIDEFAQNNRVISCSRRYAHPNQWMVMVMTIPNNVAELVELIIKSLNLGPVHVIGHSY